MAHHKNMAITPLPNPIPKDLGQIEALIKERYTRIDEIDEEISSKQTEKADLRSQVAQLQDTGKRLLMITPRTKIDKEKRNSKTGEEIAE